MVGECWLVCVGERVARVVVKGAVGVSFIRLYPAFGVRDVVDV